MPTKIPDTAGCFETSDESDAAPCLRVKECSGKERGWDRDIATYNAKKQGVKRCGKTLQHSQEIITWLKELREDTWVKWDWSSTRKGLDV